MNESRIIFHIDVNSAFLSWSAARRLADGDSLDLREVPSIIGGDSTKRHGIVLAKSIPAKKFGIETAEPIASALRKCPDLIIEAPDMALYRENSRKMMEYLYNICPDLEQVSVDECYMDFTTVAHLYPSYMEAAAIIKDGIYNQFGFTVNVGISNKKVLAKMASDFEKPNKIHTLFDYEIEKKMWPLPVSDLYMCGKSSTATLYKLGIRTIGDLANADITIINDNLKAQGQMLYNFANGIDDSIVETREEEVKGIGNSTTISQDVTDAKTAKEVLLGLSDKVASRLRKDKKLAGSVTVEIKYSTFISTSHQRPLDRPADTQMIIYENACELFDALWNGNPIRLLGIRTTKLVDENEPVQMSIFDFDNVTDSNSSAKANESDTGNADTVKKSISEEKYKKMDKALDSIRDKYGYNAIKKGTSL